MSKPSYEQRASAALAVNVARVSFDTHEYGMVSMTECRIYTYTGIQYTSGRIPVNSKFGNEHAFIACVGNATLHRVGML